MAADTRLTRDAWVEAALQVLLADGPDAVAVQPLARRLDASKGSFYWHFDNRDELLRAVLERWYQVATEDVVHAVEDAGGDPGERARRLFGRVTASSATHPGQLRLLAATDHPDIRAALDRATQRRVAYVASLLRAAGMTPAVARRRATLAYATYLGHAQLLHSTPDVLPASARGRRALRDELMDVLLAP